MSLNDMDVLQNVRVKINKHYKCCSASFETPNTASFKFNRLQTNVLANNIEISGLRHQYECYAKMLIGNSVVYVQEHAVDGKIVIPVNGTVDYLTAVLKIGLQIINVNVYVTEDSSVYHGREKNLLLC
ncbi:hypothetical protein [Epiphyas postvittana nucleopolyhedrovirus]|uniref:Uncharacterized protein n=1 Tax=Epiphyas postvittana nucleopolyhedrovirus TaxID=70600 RepID=Q91GK7_NPVEP|nr:hypothetical protein [Epiphyas postvittana nucleopolyhedrovirus]AAK85608.1 unknown [Epiphyas postvittana nucleopolyhedrovirus]